MISGIAICVGDHVDTDVIIAAKYCTSIDPDVLGSHLLETSELPPEERNFKGSILVAGTNFGCGSAREHAALAMQGAGVLAVVARSFSRTFFRNAVNIALPVFELQTVVEIHSGDDLEIDTEAGILRIKKNGQEYSLPPYPEIIQSVMNAGGMIEFVRRRLAEKEKAGEN